MNEKEATIALVACLIALFALIGCFTRLCLYPMASTLATPLIIRHTTSTHNSSAGNSITGSVDDLNTSNLNENTETQTSSASTSLCN